MSLNTVIPGQSSLVSLVIKLNNGQSYPVQFLLPPGLTPDLSNYPKFSDLAGYITNSLNFNPSIHTKALSLYVNNATGNPLLLAGSTGSPVAKELLTTQSGISGVTGANTLRGDKRGVSLYLSSQTNNPVFVSDMGNGVTQAQNIFSSLGSDFFNNTGTTTSEDGNSSVSNCVGSTANGQSAYIQASVNNTDSTTSALLGVTDSEGRKNTLLTATQDGKLLTSSGHNLVECNSPTGKNRKILSWYIPRPSGGPFWEINFPEAFSTTNNLQVFVTYVKTTGRWVRTMERPGICVGAYTTTSFYLDDGSGAGSDGVADGFNIIAIGDV